MLKIFLGILAVILAVALLTNRSDKDEVAAPLPAAGQTPAAASAGVNPPHGQPGHRCDIAVGAPLPSGSAPAAASAPAASAPASTAPVAAPAQEESAVALNPPHGQPGHDCAVPVGRPLPKK